MHVYCSSILFMCVGSIPTLTTELKNICRGLLEIVKTRGNWRTVELIQYIYSVKLY